MGRLRGSLVAGWLLCGLAVTAPASAHDVNGDGLDDMVVRGRGEFPRTAAVVFGGPGASSVSRSAPGSRGFVIRTPLRLDSAESVGDMDGDGLSEVVLSGYTEVRSRTIGRVYLVWGRREPGSVDVTRDGAAATRIRLGRRSATQAGPVGDVDGDGLADLAITHYDRSDSHGRISVLRGTRERSGFGLAASFSASSLNGRLQPFSAQPAGDVNGDGVGDVLAAFELLIYCGEGGSCGTRPFVLFGSTAPADRRLRGRLKTGLTVLDAGGQASGFEITPPGPEGALGYEGGGAGDFNGDGLDDIVASALWYDTVDPVVFGRAGTDRVLLPSARWRAWPGGLGIRHAGRSLETDSASDVAGIGDVTGDGLDDVVVSELNGRALRVVPGRSTAGLADLRVPGEGIRILLPRASRRAYDVTSLERAVALGDTNSDGNADVLLDISTPTGPSRYRRRSFVVLGPITGERRLTALGSGGFEIH